MKIVLLGYGRMGHVIEKVAESRGHEIVDKLDEGWSVLPECDVVVEFTSPSNAPSNIIAALKQGLPVVSGTTGWLEQWDNVADHVEALDGTFFYASNFSIGVHLFRKITKDLARYMNSFPQYDVSVEEVHHVHKIDYPSGTALTIAQDILEQLARKSDIQSYLAPAELPASVTEKTIPIHSIREEEVPGVHRVTFECDQDTIRLEHEAHGREGLALGAVLAAEYIQGKKGIFGMDNLLKL